jgi:hypothetical protein
MTSFRQIEAKVTTFLYAPLLVGALAATWMLASCARGSL